MPRRIITGLNSDGQSAVLIDDAVDHTAGGAAVVWATETLPADNSAPADATPPEFSFDLMHGGGSSFIVMQYPAEMPEYWHATDTVDYITILEGEIVFATETGEVTLKPGDVLVDRGIRHCWRNHSGQPARAAIVLLPAQPLGEGRTM